MTCIDLVKSRCRDYNVPECSTVIISKARCHFNTIKNKPINTTCIKQVDFLVFFRCCFLKILHIGMDDLYNHIIFFTIPPSS